MRLEAMSPEDAAQHIARFLTQNPAFTEDGVYASMAAAGVPERGADLAYKFTQVAWARVSLDGLSIRFADDYYCLDGNGDVVDSGKLAEQPHFVAATRLGRRYAAEPGFKQMAMMSADFHSV